MWDENCVVVVQQPQETADHQSSLFQITSQKQEAHNILSASGLLVNCKHGFVITTATLFPSQVENFTSSHVPRIFLTEKDFDRTRVTIIFQDKSLRDTQRQFLSVPGKLILLWRCEDFHQVLIEHFSDKDGWKFGDFEEDGSPTEKSQKTIIEPFSLKSEIEMKENPIVWFALIKLESTEKLKSSIGNKTLEHFPSIDLHQGNSLLACGTPFGSLCPPVFMNSLSTGIVTNLAGKNNTLIMTDARVMPGSEGAGLYVLPHGDIKQRNLVGMIVSAICWKANEWIGLTLAVSISALFDSLQRLSHLPLPESPVPNVVDHDVDKDRWTSDVRDAISSVVYVQVGPIWGSGVIVDKVKGYIVTCRHVVKNSRSRGVKIFIRHPRPMWIAADVVFLTSGSSPFDLALLQLKHCPAELPAAKQAAIVKKGQRLLAVGHALFGFEVQKQPSVMAGIVSNTVTYKNQLVMVQSTCAVHGGASGGALLCAETGQLIGIIASNSRDTDNNVSFPHVNFSIPATLFWQPIKEFSQSEDLRRLEPLNHTDTVVRSLWQLDAPEINFTSKL